MTSSKICSLCLENREFARAHIISKGLLKLLSSPENFDANIIFIDPKIGPISRPGGSYDKNILCQDCDNKKLGPYDKYAKIFLLKTKLSPHPLGSAWQAAGVDQNRLKLFCLSYLWRASISSLKEFKNVSLGSKHEERIRLMLLNADSGSPTDYTTYATRYTARNNFEKIHSKIAMAPLRIHSEGFEGLNFYEIHLPNLYKFLIKVDSQNFSNTDLYDESLGVKDPLTIFNKGEFEESTEFRELIKLRRKF